MVGAGDAAYYSAILESLYEGLAGLDTTGYQWDTTDRWTQARYVDPTRGGSQHLEVWIDLGAVVAFERSRLVHQGSLTVACRYVPDDDSVAQGRIHAAARHALEYLQDWRPATGARALPQGYQLETLSAEWVAVTVTFLLQLPRGD